MKTPGTIRGEVFEEELHLKLPVAGGPVLQVQGDKGGEDAEEEEDEQQVAHHGLDR